MLASDVVGNPDDALWVRFFKKSVQNGYKTQQAGHPVFDEVDFVSIISPGDPNNKPERKATAEDKQRFPKQWANYQANNADKIEGTAIEEWTKITRSQADELKYLGIRSIEQLVMASDNQVQKIMGGMSLREQAKAYLAKAKDNAFTEKIAAENAALNNRIKALEEQLASLGAKVEKTEVKSDQPSAIPKRRGRPPKVKPPEAA